MTKLVALAAGLLAVTVAACATPSVYAPASQPGAYGYSEQRVERDRMIVRFTGNAATTPELAEAFVLRRAAELTLADGHEWFHVVSRRSDARGGSSGPRIGVGAGGATGGGSSVGGVGVGLSFPIGSSSAGYAETAIEIVMRRGPVPPGLSGVYDARLVLAN